MLKVDLKLNYKLIRERTQTYWRIHVKTDTETWTPLPQAKQPRAIRVWRRQESFKHWLALWSCPVLGRRLLASRNCSFRFWVQWVCSDLLLQSADIDILCEFVFMKDAVSSGTESSTSAIACLVLVTKGRAHCQRAKAGCRVVKAHSAFKVWYHFTGQILNECVWLWYLIKCTG